MLSAWAGAHFIADQVVGSMATLSVHVMFGLASIPVFMMVIWYPQRMLGQEAIVKTRAAIAADAELSVQQSSQNRIDTTSVCPECDTEVNISRNTKGDIELPCSTKGCTTIVVVGSACQSCKAIAPTRYDCPSCGINAPVLDFLSDVEAW